MASASTAVPLPFTPEQFFAVFREYNEAVWPAQAGLLVLAVGALVLVFVRTGWRDRAVSLILAFLWPGAASSPIGESNDEHD